MKYIADLHTHSTASDGQHSPAELVGLAKEAGIEVLAITDHDTVDGVGEALEAGRTLGVRVIPGIELSAREYNTFHILGYGIDPADPGLNARCEERRASRDRRSLRIIEYLAEKGMPISLEEVEAVAGGIVIGRPHFARVMLDKGYITNYRHAFDLYLDTQEYHDYMGNARPPVERCIRVLKGAGGKVSMAHPHQIGIDNEALEEQVRELVALGLDAIECYYPKHTEAQTAFYLKLAEKYGLHVTGGSDFPGEKVKTEIRLARLELDLVWLGSK